jgi:hypothetical protein
MCDHSDVGVCPCQLQAWHEARREIIEWCNEVIGDRDLSDYDKFGSLREDPNALAVTLAVEVLKLLGVPR